MHVGGTLWHGYRGEAHVGMQTLQVPQKVTQPVVGLGVPDDVVDPLQFCRAEGAVVRRWWRLGGWRGHGLPHLDCGTGRWAGPLGVVVLGCGLCSGCGDLGWSSLRLLGCAVCSPWGPRLLSMHGLGLPGRLRAFVVPPQCAPPAPASQGRTQGSVVPLEVRPTRHRGEGRPYCREAPGVAIHGRACLLGAVAGRPQGPRPCRML